jgi:hypothetical protein
MHDVVFCPLGISYRRGSFGGLGMERKLIFGKIDGCPFP